MTSPIKIERLKKELEKLHQEMVSGQYAHSEYDQRLSRVIQELRERGIDADRPKITEALGECLQQGVITPAVKEHLEKRLGLA
jgi:hypothetical protein